MPRKSKVKIKATKNTRDIIAVIAKDGLKSKVEKACRRRDITLSAFARKAFTAELARRA